MANIEAKTAEMVFRPHGKGETRITDPEGLVEHNIHISPQAIERTWGSDAIERYHRITARKAGRPELFSDPAQIILKRGQRVRVLSIRTSPEGVYLNGDGQFWAPEDRIFKSNGFDKPDDEIAWTSKAYVVESRQ